jgi:hypothetical protein
VFLLKSINKPLVEAGNNSSSCCSKKSPKTSPTDKLIQNNKNFMDSRKSKPQPFERDVANAKNTAVKVGTDVIVGLASATQEILNKNSSSPVKRVMKGGAKAGVTGIAVSGIGKQVDREFERRDQGEHDAKALGFEDSH